MIVDPIRKYQIKPANAASGQVCTLLSKPFGLGVGNDQQVIAAITGKRIRIMGLMVQADGAGNPYIGFQTGAAGARILGAFYPSIVTLPPFLLPITDSGYAETIAGDGLYADVGVAAVTGSVFYVAYVP